MGEERQWALSWSADNETGVLWQDIQHENLFEYIFIAKDALTYNDEEKIKELLSYLKCYVKQHFATEEGYMDKFEDPERDHHKREHNEFRTKLDKIIADINDQYGDHVRRQAQNLLDDLWAWYLEHINVIDLRLGKLIKEHGIF